MTIPHGQSDGARALIGRSVVFVELATIPRSAFQINLLEIDGRSDVQLSKKWQIHEFAFIQC